MHPTLDPAQMERRLTNLPLPRGSSSRVFVIGNDFSRPRSPVRRAMDSACGIAYSTMGYNDGAKKLVVLADGSDLSFVRLYRTVFHEQCHDYFREHPAEAREMAREFCAAAIELSQTMERLGYPDVEVYKSFFPEHCLELVRETTAWEVTECDSEEVAVRVCEHLAVYPMLPTSCEAKRRHPELFIGYNMLLTQHEGAFRAMLAERNEHVRVCFLDSCRVGSFCCLWRANQTALFSSIPMAARRYSRRLQGRTDFDAWVSTRF
jgi:hypothetical protein